EGTANHPRDHPLLKLSAPQPMPLPPAIALVGREGPPPSRVAKREIEVWTARRPYTGALMLRPSRGRHGFAAAPWPDGVDTALRRPPRELVKRLLRREAERRHEPATQAYLDAHAGQDPEPFYLELQRAVASELGFAEPDEQAWAVAAMRTATALFP